MLLGWFADAAEPDAGLLAFRQVSEALGDSPWFLRLLRDETKAAERMARVLASQPLRDRPAAARARGGRACSPTTPSWCRRPADAAARRDDGRGRGRHDGDAEQAAVAVRSLRRRELFRVAAADVLGLIGPGARRARR